MKKYIWITNGHINKKILVESEIPLGWYNGRSNVHSKQTKKFLSECGKRNNPEKRKQTILKRYGSFDMFGNSNGMKRYHAQKRLERRSLPFDEKSIDYKRQQILEEQNEKCLFCNLSEWLGNPIKFELDHIDGDNSNNKREKSSFIMS